MQKVVITTDSGSNPRDMSNMLPCVVTDSKNISYYDMKKVSNDSKRVISNVEVFDRALTGERFHTSSPNINDYLVLMKPYLDDGYDIVHLSMGSGISAGSVNASLVAKEMLDDEYGENRVNVIDTLSGGSGGTVLNDYANSLVKKNLTSEEIVEELEEVKKRTVASFYISKVAGFVASGRAPNVAILSDKFHFRFRVDINNKGKLFPKIPPYRGSINKEFMKFVKTFINNNNIEEYDPNFLALVTTRLEEINVNEAIDYINSFDYFNKDMLKKIDFYSAISSYGVIDQVGIGLIKKK